MITCILMPYRKENIRQIIPAIRRQTIKSEIWIWDDKGNNNGIGEDVYFYCNRDFFHRPRFLVAGLVKTEYIFIQDDDYIITDDKLFEKLIVKSKEIPDYILGVAGRNFTEIKGQDRPYQSPLGWLNDGKCQFINTGVSFFRTEIINKLEINPLFSKYIANENEYKFGDDMYISFLNNCYTTEILKQGMGKLDEQGLGVSHKSEHMEIRNKLVKRYWL